MYWNEGLVGEGTILNVCQTGCQVTGTMAVAVGMRLTLQITPPLKEHDLSVEEARVLWAHDNEFELEFRRLPAIDQRELMGFLQATDHQIASEGTLNLPSRKSCLSTANFTRRRFSNEHPQNGHHAPQLGSRGIQSQDNNTY
jgi:hypothetical protein